MNRYRVHSERENRSLEAETALEEQADRLLRGLPEDPHCPVYTEAQLARRGRGENLARCVASVEALGDELPASRLGQAFYEEILFAASLTRLTRCEWICLHGWLEGYTQQEITVQSGGASQQTISRLLRRALHKCHRTGLSFTQFSRHVLYRRPVRLRMWRERTCCYCREPYAAVLGVGSYCSEGCREAARHRINHSA